MTPQVSRKDPGFSLVELAAFDTSSVTNLARMFKNSYLDANLSGWDASNVTDMTEMFMGNSLFYGNGLDSWDVSNVRYMDRMFHNVGAFLIDLSGWDVENVESWNNWWTGARTGDENAVAYTPAKFR